MKLTKLLAFVLIANISLNAQIFPDGERYLSEVFDTVTVTEDLEYGSNTSVGNIARTFLMDIWEPAGDTAQYRPLVVVAHGGAFIQGQPSDMDLLCETLAKRGYVVSNISYRLYDALVSGDSTIYQESVIMAIQDMKAAVRYMRRSAFLGNEYNIDTNFVFAAGASAGAIMAAHVGYMDAQDDIPDYIQTIINNNGGIEGSSSDSTLQHSSSVQGILNYSGALLRARFMDNNTTPIYSAHDDQDPIVIYGSGDQGTLLGFSLFIEGSETIHTRAEQLGLKNKLFTVENSAGHVSFFESNFDLYADSVLDESSQFMFEIMFPDITDVNDEQLALNEYRLGQNYPNPFNPSTTISYSIPETGLVTLKVYDVTGQLVTKLVNETKAAGKYSISWNASALSSGVYFYTIQSGSYFESNKMMLLK